MDANGFVWIVRWTTTDGCGSFIFDSYEGGHAHFDRLNQDHSIIDLEFVRMKVA